MLKTPILKTLQMIEIENIVSFHMPGHKKGRAYDKINNIDFKNLLYRLDTTEILGTDNLHNPKGIIKQSQEMAKKVFKSKETFFLVNGSTSGIYSMIMACTSPGDKIIIGRNCHKSVINATILGDLIPIYVQPEIEKEQGIALGICPEKIRETIQKHPDAKAVIISYPTYHGIASDLKKIAQIVHEYDKILLVDEAHGAHLGLSSKLPMTALECGADAVVQSTHKTLPSFTQSSMLHTQGDRIDVEKLKSMLRIHQSSSPSYLLMLSLELAVMIYMQKGKELMHILLENIEIFKRDVEALNIYITGNEIGLYNSVKSFDPTKLWISIPSYRGNGYNLEKSLREQFQIQMELSNSYGILGITSIANEKDDFDKLYKALKILSQETISLKNDIISFNINKIPNQILTPRQAFYAKNEIIPIDKSIGHICGEYVIPYPPGIPVLIPGEQIDQESIYNIKAAKYQKIDLLGLQDQTYRYIKVVKGK